MRIVSRTNPKIAELFAARLTKHTKAIGAVEANIEPRLGRWVTNALDA